MALNFVGCAFRSNGRAMTESIQTQGEPASQAMGGFVRPQSSGALSAIPIGGSLTEPNLRLQRCVVLGPEWRTSCFRILS